MILEERMKRAIALRDDVFLRSELAHLGSKAQVSRALRCLIRDGVIVKLGVGVYAKAKKSILSGNPIPVRPLAVLAPMALQKLGIVTYPSELTQQYNSGKSTQIPASNVLNTGGRRVSRRLSFGKQAIVYENNNSSASRAR